MTFFEFSEFSESWPNPRAVWLLEICSLIVVKSNFLLLFVGWYLFRVISGNTYPEVVMKIHFVQLNQIEWLPCHFLNVIKHLVCELKYNSSGDMRAKNWPTSPCVGKSKCICWEIKGHVLEHETSCFTWCSLIWNIIQFHSQTQTHGWSCKTSILIRSSFIFEHKHMYEVVKLWFWDNAFWFPNTWWGRSVFSPHVPRWMTL